MIVIEGAKEPENDDAWWTELTVVEHVEHYIKEGDDQKDAIKKAAKDRGVPKRDVYSEYHKGQ